MGETTVSVHQPNFMPWLKLLDKILASDVYVAYDTVLYTKSEYHTRQKVLTANGPVWLSVPVQHVKGVQQLIKDVHIDNGQPFRRRHLRTLRLAYAATPYFAEVYPIIEEVYSRDHTLLVDLNIDLIEALCAYLGAPVRVVRASSLPHDGSRTKRLVDLVQAATGSVHLTSTYGSEQHVDWTEFLEAGIEIRAQRFEHPAYSQLGDDFVPHLAAIDMLFACGRATADILARSRMFVEAEPVSGTTPAR